MAATSVHEQRLASLEILVNQLSAELGEQERKVRQVAHVCCLLGRRVEELGRELARTNAALEYLTTPPPSCRFDFSAALDELSSGGAGDVSGGEKRGRIQITQFPTVKRTRITLGAFSNITVEH